MKWLLILLAAACFGPSLVAQETRSTELKSPGFYVEEGMELFRKAKIPESITAFETAARLAPNVKPHLWQLGISYYYAGQFEKGQKLFESHQTVNPQDVENAIFHFLCVSKIRGVSEARKRFISITEDSRVPMKELHALFAGKGDERRVLEAARAGNPREEDLRNRLFYAHLYLGLYEEALGHPNESLEHMKKAAEEYKQPHYMGAVAQVHVKLRNAVSEQK